MRKTQKRNETQPDPNNHGIRTNSPPRRLEVLVLSLTDHRSTSWGMTVMGGRDMLAEVGQVVVDICLRCRVHV